MSTKASTSFLETLDKEHRVAGKKVAYLHNTSVDSGKAAQSNKYYYLYEQSDGTIKIVRGRIDHTVVVEPKRPSIHEWDAIIRKKTQRSSDAYTDVTHLFQEMAEVVVKNNPQATMADIQNAVVKKLMDELQAFANKSVQQNYTISSEKVTEAMVNEAQKALDNITREIKIGAKVANINKHLMALYMIVPRRMDNVKSYLLSKDIKTQSDLQEAQEKIANEQATLDVMAGQVAQIKAAKEALSKDPNTKKETKTILDVLGLEMSPVVDTAIIKMLKEKMGKDSGSFKQAFEVTNKRTRAAYEANLKAAKEKKVELFFHGSRNPNWISILERGLLIRPAGAGYNGSAFGDGIYFANKASKSLNYTGWTGAGRSYVGYGERKVFLALFEVRVGKQKIVHHTCSPTKTSLTKEGYDSVWAQANSQSYIANDEFIVFDPAQCTVKYLIEVSA